MKISIAKNDQPADSTIYLVKNKEDFKDLELPDAERKYLEERLQKEGGKVVRVHRLPQFWHFVKPPEKSKAKATEREKLRLLGNKTLRMAKAEDVKKIKVVSLNGDLSALDFAEGMALGAYQFLKYFKDKDKKKIKVEEIEIYGADKKEVAELNAKIAAVYKARDLVNEPLSFLTAEQLSKEAEKVAGERGIKTEVFNKKKIQSLKMGGLLAVNKGSQDPPTFTILEYKPRKAVNKQPVVLVGKGVVYDTGGMSLKPTAGSMDSMKSDMGGAAACIGAMMAIAEAKLPVKVTALIPATDNRPGENAYVPGDVITMFDGSTVEVLNTDAEGRMILADALAYAKKLKPQIVVDLATLTGAAAVAVGKYGVVAMGTAESEMMEKLKQAGDECYERVAEFPFWEEYDELLKSSIADQKNIGGREGGAITAGKFLQKFTDYPWIHIDIAGPAFLDSDHGYRLKGGTGVGVRLMFEFVKSLAE